MTDPQHRSAKWQLPGHHHQVAFNHNLARSSRAHSPNVGHRRNQARAAETFMMMAVNSIIAVIAVLALIRLAPYNASQRTKLRSLEAEVNTLDNRVENLREEFTNHFDPQQSRTNMRVLGDRLEYDQREIIFISPSPEEDTPTEQSESNQVQQDNDIAPTAVSEDDT